MPLQDILTEREPTGPADQSLVGDPIAAAALLDGVPTFLQPFDLGVSIILGMRGAGKSSILTGFDSRAKFGRSHGIIDHNLAQNGDFVIKVVAWDQLHDMVRRVASALSPDLIQLGMGDLLFPEKVAQLWDEVMWDEILKCFYSFGRRQPSFPDELLPVRSYFDHQGLNTDAIDLEEESQRIFTSSQSAVLSYLSRSKRRCYVLFDSMESYPVRNPIFKRVVAGLLRAINHFNTNHTPTLRIVFCLPEEIETFVSDESANLLKDYAAAYRLRWKPIDVLRIAAHRYRLFLRFRDPEHYEQFASLNFSVRDDVHQFYSALLPKSITNRYGLDEDPLAYIVRHSQLLPRHIILMFNAIAYKSHEMTGGYRAFLPESITEGVEEAEDIIAEHVLTLYRQLYPQLISACQDILPDVTPICTFSDLSKAATRFKRRVEDDVVEPWKTLFQMGVIGRVEEDGGRSTDRYVYGAFRFNHIGAMGFGSRARYCFHPIFSKRFGMNRDDMEEKLFVYPANIGDINLASGAFG